MLIELQRALTPGDIGPQDCGICGLRFTVEGVAARVVGIGGGNDRFDGGCACRVCVKFLAARNPQRFPSLEEYEEALRRYPEPIFTTDEEMARSEDAGTFWDVYAASWLPR